MTLPAVTVELDGTPIEDEVLEGVVITYGRQRPSDVVEPSTCSITLLTPAQPWGFTIGSEVVVDAEVAAVTYRRFTGTVIQIDASKYTTTITCTSAALGAFAAAQAPAYDVATWAPGLGNIILDAAAAAGFRGFITVDPGTTTPVAPYDIPAGYLLEQLRTIAALDVQGLIWEDQSGEAYFSDANSRASITPFTAIDADTVSDRWTASATVNSVINQVSVTYNSQTAVVTMTDASSQLNYGIRSYEVDFNVVDVDDATLKASKILAGYSEPTWITNPITIQLGLIATNTDTAKMLQLVCGTPIDLQEVTDEIDVIPADAFVEGYTETIRQTNWVMELWVSDVHVTRAPQQWQDVTPTLAWSSVSGTLTWYDAIGVTL
jgi:hypothetical protein